jgi:rhodanese-related sulfurtransferase
MQHLQPLEAWAQLQNFKQQGLPSLFVDVRMEIESMYVGRPPGVVNIPWYEYPDFTADAQAFVSQVLAETGGDTQRPVFLICRSGSRTLDAGAALEQAGFTQVINVLNGFEGDPDENHHRSSLNGWRFDGLPWEQM